MLFLGQVLAQESTPPPVNTSYENWYYASREKLYQSLLDRHYDVIFFGNSITEHGPWQELIGRRYKIGNRGIGGDNTFGMNARIENVAKHQPKKIFLMMGINDVGSSIPTSMIIDNYKKVVETIQRVSPKTKIYIQSPLPLNESVLLYDYLKGKEVSVKALIAGAREIAERYKLTYVDLNEVLAEDDVLKKEFTTDGIHVNIDAYKVWVAYLKHKRFL
jgi:lysophospholipase L1-like esterase